MSYTGHEDHSITLAEAATLTQNFRTSHPTDLLGGAYGRDAIEAILAQPECVGIRIYFAEKDGNLTTVLVGVKANEDDLYMGTLADSSHPIPPYLGPPNPLNT